MIFYSFAFGNFALIIASIDHFDLVISIEGNRVMYIESSFIIQPIKTQSNSIKVMMSAIISIKPTTMRTITIIKKTIIRALRTTPLSLSPPLYLSSPSTSVRLQDKLLALTKPLSHHFSLSSPFPSRDPGRPLRSAVVKKKRKMDSYNCSS